MRRFVSDHSLALVLIAITVLILAAQSFAGWRNYNEQQMQMRQPEIAYPSYLVSPDYYDDVMSNWQSEFLQITLYTMFAVWFRQKGSAESRGLRDSARSSDEQEMLGDHLRPDSRSGRARVAGGCGSTRTRCSSP